MAKKVYIRRCHVCGEINESTGHSVKSCACCGKKMAPFFYFHEKHIVGFGDLVEKETIKRENPPGMYLPVYGLTVYW